VLQTTSKPEPFPLTLRGQSVEQGAFLLKAIIRECLDANIRLQRVEADPELLRHMTSNGSIESGCYMDVPVESAPDLGGELRFFRDN
jgi:hypothetical protein